MLSCRALRKSYVTERGEVLAVGGIDLDVEAGRYAAIIGRSGSGKSSLMAMVGGLSRPSIVTVPSDGRLKPPTMAISEDLPEPERPMMAA